MYQMKAEKRLSILDRMEAFSDNLTCIRDQNKCLWISNLDEITQADSLGTVERSQDDRFVLTGISTRCVKDAGTAVQLMNDEITDRFRVVTYNIKIFGQIEVLDKGVYHERTNRKSEQRI